MAGVVGMREESWGGLLVVLLRVLMLVGCVFVKQGLATNVDAL
jgi:hypothetical protein